jgi:hypothetical protein
MTGKKKFLIALIVIPSIIGIAAIGINIKRNKTIARFEQPTNGQIYTISNGESFHYKKIKSISKDSIYFYLCNYEAVRGDKLLQILEKKDAFSEEIIAYSRAELKIMMDAKLGDNSLFNITDPEN